MPLFLRTQNLYSPCVQKNAKYKKKYLPLSCHSLITFPLSLRAVGHD